MSESRLPIPETLWYEDKDGNKLPSVHPAETPEGAEYQVCRDLGVEERSIGQVTQEDVDACPHDDPKRIRRTGGWIDGMQGRECQKCGGTQTRHEGEAWPKEWQGGRCYTVIALNRGWDDELVTKMVRRGDYTAREAVLIGAIACERCMNVLLHEFSGMEWEGEQHDFGYPIGSDEELMAHTTCELCDAVSEYCKEDAVPCRGAHVFREVEDDEWYPDDDEPPLYVCKHCGCYGKEIDFETMERHLAEGGEPLPQVVSTTTYRYKLRGLPKKATADNGCCCCKADAPPCNCNSNGEE